MSDDGIPKRRRGNPNWVKGMASPNTMAGVYTTRDRNPRTSQELDIRALAQQWTPQAIAVAAELMLNIGKDKKIGTGDVPHTVRLSAADLLLKRGHGQPIQPHANPDLTPLNFAEMSDEQIMTNAARLDALIAKTGIMADALKGPDGKAH